MHSDLPKKQFEYKCPMTDCRTSVDTPKKLDLHLRIHNNDFEECQFCPYRYYYPAHYERHLRRHFGITEFKCDQCEKEFETVGQLNIHYTLHEGIIYFCKLCDGYKASNRNAMSHHLRGKHTSIVGKHFKWDAVEKYIKKETI